MRNLTFLIAAAMAASLATGPAHAGIIAGSTSEIMVESRSGGQNVGWYSQAGTWSTSTSKSTAPGVTAGIGSTFTSNAFTGRSFTVAPDFGPGGTFDVYVTAAANFTANQPLTVAHAGGTANLTPDLSSGITNAWKLLGTWTFGPGFGGSVTIATNGAGGNVLRGDAVLFAEIPEPTTIFLAAFGIAQVLVINRRRRIAS